MISDYIATAIDYSIYKDGSYFTSTTETSYIDDLDIIPETTYEYYITAVDMHGNEGIASGIDDETTSTLSVDLDILPNQFMLFPVML